MSKFKKFFVFLVSFFALGSALPLTVHAQTTGGTLLCKIFPFINNLTAFGISSLCGGLNTGDTAATLKSIVSLIVSLIFVGIIVFAIYVIIKSAIKYIRSEGDEAKIQEATKAIKSVFIGIGALFVGLIGLVIILAFFNAGGALNSDTGVGNVKSNLLNEFLTP